MIKWENAKSGRSYTNILDRYPHQTWVYGIGIKQIKMINHYNVNHSYLCHFINKQ